MNLFYREMHYSVAGSLLLLQRFGVDLLTFRLQIRISRYRAIKTA